MDHSSFQDARALLPLWVVWAPGLVTLGAAAATWVATRAVALLALRPLRRLPPEAHWTERARLAQPARVRVFTAGLLIAMVTGATLPGGPLSLPPPPLRLLAHALLLLAIVAGGGFFLERRLLPGPTWRERVVSLATWLVLLYPGLLGALLFALAAGPTRTVPAWGTAIAAALAVALATGGGLVVGRLVGLVRPPGERLVRALALAREGATGRPPALFELPVVSANALALPFFNAVGVTDGALRALDDAELAAVLRHELGHLAEGSGTRALRFVNAAAIPVVVTLTPALAGTWRGFALPIALFAVALWLFSLRRLGRGLEQRADAAAHAQPREYASALEKIHRANLIPAVLGRRASHPDLHDRMLAAGVTPEWPKPEPPPRGRRRALLLAPLVIGATVAGTLAWVWLGARDPDDRSGLLWNVALRQRPHDLAMLGRWHFERSDYPGAATLYLAAEALDPTRALYPAVAALALGRLGRCDEALVALERAEAAEGARDYVEEVRAELDECSPPPDAGSHP